MKRALLILGVESPENGREVERIAGVVRGRIGYDLVEAICLKSGASLAEGIAAALVQGVTQVVVVPYALSLGAQALEAIRQGIAEARRTAPGVEVVVGEAVGMDDRIPDIICDRARAAEVRMESGEGRPLLTIDGLVRRPRRLTYADLLAAPDQVEDVSGLAPGRQGAGVRVGGLLREAEPAVSAVQVTVHASEEGFEATVSLAEASARGILIYRLNDAPLSERMGGPVRLIIPGTEDACNNVKRVVRMEVRA